MSVLGQDAVIHEISEGSQCNVRPFCDSYKTMKNVNVVNGYLAFDTLDGRTYILEVNQALDFSSQMKHSILCTNQARANQVIVDDVPKFLDITKQSKQAVIFSEDNVELDIKMKGPVPYSNVRKPSQDEINNCPHLTLTSADDWDSTMDDWADILQVSQTGVEFSHFVDFEFHDNPVSFLISQVRVTGVTTKRHGSYSPEQLSRTWGVSLDKAKLTLESTKHDSIRTTTGSISRRVKTLPHQRQYKQLGGYLGHICSDTFKSNVTSLSGHNYIQLFANCENFTECYPLKVKSDANQALDAFIHDVGIPVELLTGGAKELHLGEWLKKCKKHNIHMRLTEPHSPWQNQVELMGGLIKRKVRRLMRNTNTPIRLWDYCWRYVASIQSLTASNQIQLDGRTPYEKVHGYTPNISEFIQNKWYDWIIFHEPDDPMKWNVGRWLGPAHSSGQGMAYNVLKSNGRVAVRSTIYPIEDLQMDDEAIKASCVN